MFCFFSTLFCVFTSLPQGNGNHQSVSADLQAEIPSGHQFWQWIFPHLMMNFQVINLYWVYLIGFAKKKHEKFRIPRFSKEKHREKTTAVLADSEPSSRSVAFLGCHLLGLRNHRRTCARGTDSVEWWWLVYKPLTMYICITIYV